MARFVMRLPDLGEGTVSAEVISWKVRVGETIAEDAPLVEMSTEKAVVEVPSPVSGRIVSLTGNPGDVIAVGAELAVFETSGEASSSPRSEAPSVVPAVPVAPAAPAGQALAAVEATPAAAIRPATTVPPTPAPAPRPEPAPVATGRARVQASPAVRRKAFECGLDLAAIVGSGPAGRILDEDLERARAGTPGVEEIPVIGIRRVIAQRMAEAKRVAPHFAYIEEVDVTALETLRQRLGGAGKLTYLPFITRALALVLREFPQCNAHYDEKRNVIRRFVEVHAGIATQTADGLKVPVVRNVLAHDLESLTAELRRVSEAARTGTARREELSGSTITITSLGKLGGIAATPILNLPEVAIVGVNKAIERVVVQDGKMVIRRMMNLSSSFDHRFVDGFDAAAMVQALKAKLEQPESIFE